MLPFGVVRAFGVAQCVSALPKHSLRLSRAKLPSLHARLPSQTLGRDPKYLSMRVGVCVAMSPIKSRHYFFFVRLLLLLLPCTSVKYVTNSFQFDFLQSCFGSQTGC